MRCDFQSPWQPLIAGSLGTGTDASYSSIQVLGTPTQPVFFTSYDDQSLGVDTKPDCHSTTSRRLGGIEIHNDVDRAQGRAAHMNVVVSS